MLTRQQKKEIVKGLTDKFKKAKSVVFTDFTGLTVNDLQALRQELKEKGSHYQVIKKTLLDLALKKAGIDFDLKQFQASLAVSFSDLDEVAPAKILYNFSKAHENLKLLAGLLFVPEKTVLNQDQVIALAKIPAKEELIAKIIGSLNAPLQNFAYCLKANLRNLVYILKQKATRNQ